MQAASDPELHDSRLDSEIGLLGEVMAAAALAPAHLTQDEVDTVLGVHGLPIV